MPIDDLYTEFYLPLACGTVNVAVIAGEAGGSAGSGGIAGDDRAACFAPTGLVPADCQLPTTCGADYIAGEAGGRAGSGVREEDGSAACCAPTTLATAYGTGLT